MVPRNLSCGGMSFLRGGFVYLGTHCTITLRGLDGKAHGNGARIARCQHVRRRLHDVGVACDAPIKAREFIDFGDQHAFTVENVDVTTLKGTLLIIEDSRADQRLYAHHFKGSGLDVQFAQDADTGLQCHSDLPDVVFTDYQLPGMNGIRLISTARSRGYTGPIVLITVDTGPGLRAAAIKAGASEILLKPFTPCLLHQAAAEFLLTNSPSGTGASATSLSAKMVSNADVRSASGELIGDYVTELQTAADKLASLLEADDFAGSRQLVLQLKGSASGYGFEALTLIAGETARVLDACQSVGESGVDLRILIAACRSARPRADAE